MGLGSPSQWQVDDLDLSLRGVYLTPAQKDLVVHGGQAVTFMGLLSIDDVLTEMDGYYGPVPRTYLDEPGWPGKPLWLPRLVTCHPLDTPMLGASGEQALADVLDGQFGQDWRRFPSAACTTVVYGAHAGYVRGSEAWVEDEPTPIRLWALNPSITGSRLDALMDASARLVGATAYDHLVSLAYDQQTLYQGDGDFCFWRPDVDDDEDLIATVRQCLDCYDPNATDSYVETVLELLESGHVIWSPSKQYESFSSMNEAAQYADALITQYALADNQEAAYEINSCHPYTEWVLAPEITLDLRPFTEYLDLATHREFQMFVQHSRIASARAATVHPDGARAHRTGFIFSERNYDPCY